jgi:peptide/nickel transport system substrate-binding protein
MHFGASRRFVGAALILFLGIAAASCSSSKPKASPSGNAPGNSASPTGNQVPDPNGTLSFAEGSPTAYPTFNIHTYAGGLTGWQTYTMLYDTLLQLSSNSLTLEPMLATSWKWNSTDTQLTMQLRNDVKFQDGEAFNADNAVANLKAAAAQGANAAAALATMTNVEATGPYTISLTFSAPSPAVLFTFAGYGGMVVAPAGLANPSQLVKTPMGSGPYELQSISTSVTYNEVFFDGYWNKSHVFPKYQQQQNIVNETTRLNAVQTGASDGTYVTGITYPTAQADKNLQMATYPGLEAYNVYMNNKIAPLNNDQVRQAISMALNRSAFAASQNTLCPAAYSDFLPGMVGYIKGYQGLGENVAQAKQMIQAAGANGAVIKMVTIPNEPFATLAQIAQAQLDAIGLNVQISQQPGAVFRVLYSQGQYGMLFAPDSLLGPDPSQIVDNYYLGQMNPGTTDPTMVAEIRSAEQLPLGTPQRTTAFEQINKDLTTKYVPWAAVCQEVQVFVANKKVIGLNNLPEAVFTAAPNEEYLQIAK